MPQLVGDDAGKFGCSDVACTVFVEKSARDKDAPVGCGKPVDRFDFIDMHLDPWQIQRARQVLVQGFQDWVGQFSGLGIQGLGSPPDRKSVHGNPVKQGEQDGGKAKHIYDMVHRHRPDKAIDLHQSNSHDVGPKFQKAK